MANEKTSYTPSYRDEIALTRHFVAVLEQKLAGRDAPRRTNTHPLDWCHLGVLGPAKLVPAPVDLDAARLEADASTDVAPTTATDTVSAGSESKATVPDGHRADSKQPQDEPRIAADRGDDREGTRRPPSAIGFEVLVQPDASGVIELRVDASFCVFTKHLPTWKEQTMVLDTGASAGAPLAEVVQRWPLAVKDLVFRFQLGGPHTQTDDGAIQSVLDEALRLAFDRSDAERIWPGTRPKVSHPDCLKDDHSFAAFLKALASGLPVEQWAIRASVEVRTFPRPDGTIRVGCYFRNETTETPPLTKGKGLKDAFKVISDVRVEAILQRGELRPIEILPVAQDYQYDRRVWAVGHNTSVRADREALTVCTVALAVYEQPRIVTRDVVPTTFAELADNPFATLEAIYTAMCDYAEDWNERVLGRNDLALGSAALEECARDYAGFTDEIRRFAAGVAAMKSDRRLLAAFKAANRVFARVAKGYDRWRLFQVVFIVTQLPALAVREGFVDGEFPVGVKRTWQDVLEWGDVLWFRTGGGKTEAYLGLACCAMLYDRLRGKRFGLTAWLRFPLRMLSIQQLQRAMRVIWETEEERKALLGVEASKSAPIRLGYFVGSTTTPNSISEEDLVKKYATEESLEWLRVVPDCPACNGRGTVRVSRDIPAIRFKHICSVCGAELPLDVSDDEIYRSLPTLVVGTIDKMATVGQQPKFGMLWGGAKWKCPQHGYAFGDYCSAFGCKVDKKGRKSVKPYDPSPALHIQDELHLLQEELGAFAGHYETLIRYCEGTVGRMPSKVVAATATIEGFENQVRHLYGVRAARRFPGRGFDKLRSFYAEPDQDETGFSKTARIFVAFKSPSLTAADASAYCAEILHIEIGKLLKKPHSALAVLRDAKTPDDVAALLNYYTTTLNYVSSLAKGSRVRQSLSDVSATVRPGGRDLNVEYHSSRSTGAEVANVVHRIESPPPWENEGFLDALVATNMISHGVDLERFNLMMMDGVPEETAEYIQASSRSGRRHVGLVVVALASFSLRATSIYHRFLEYHEHLDRMVSPVPVNRFAKYAAQRTLPGIALGLVYGLHGAQSGRSGLNKRNDVAALMTNLGPRFFQQVKEAYSLGNDVYDERLERALVDALEEQLGVVQMSIRNSNERNVKDAVRPAPMMSLRDVESGVPFWPDQGDSKLLTFVQRTKD